MGVFMNFQFGNMQSKIKFEDFDCYNLLDQPFMSESYEHTENYVMSYQVKVFKFFKRLY